MEKKSFNALSQRVSIISELKKGLNDIKPQMEIPMSKLEQVDPNLVGFSMRSEVSLSKSKLKEEYQKNISVPNVSSIEGTRDGKLVFLLPQSRKRLFQYNRDSDEVESNLQ